MIVDKGLALDSHMILRPKRLLCSKRLTNMLEKLDLESRSRHVDIYVNYSALY